MTSFDFLSESYPQYNVKILDDKGELLHSSCTLKSKVVTGVCRSFDNGEFVLDIKFPNPDVRFRPH